MAKVRSIILAAAFSFRIESTSIRGLSHRSTIRQLCQPSRIVPPWSDSICLYRPRRAHTCSIDGPRCLLHDPSDPHLGLPAATQGSGRPRLSELVHVSQSESTPSWSGHGPPLGPTSCRPRATLSRPSAILANLGPPRGHIGRRCPKSCMILIQNHHCLPTRKNIEDSHSKSPWAFREAPLRP